METTVVHYHPVDTSYSAALRRAVCESLEERGASYRLVELERDETADRTRLAETEHLIAVYPTWWGGLPARLLDWLQTTLGPDIDGPRDGSTSALARVRRLTVVATHGSGRLKNTVQGEPGRKLWERTVLGLCAPGAIFEWVALYDLDRLDRAGLERFVTKVRAAVA